MDWLLYLILILIFVVCMVMSIAPGLWGNLIMLFNVLLSGLLATNYFEPLANYLDKQASSYTYFWDFFSFWILFAVICMVLRTITDKLSRVKVKFRRPVEVAGSAILGAWVGWLMICLVLFSLHTAPLARNFLGGAFQATPKQHMFMGLAPDRKWMAFVHTLSLPESGGFATSKGPFDPNADFVLRYGGRRQEFEAMTSNRK